MDRWRSEAFHTKEILCAKEISQITHKAVFHHRTTQNPAIYYKGKAELFNSCFSSVFQPARPDQYQASIFFSSQLRIESQLRETELSECDVVNCLRNLDMSKASGPDGIPASLLKKPTNHTQSFWKVLF